MGAGKLAAAGVALIAALTLAAPAAQATTIGSTALPDGATPTSCLGPGGGGGEPPVLFQFAGAAPSYTVPGGGALVSWSMNTLGGPAGTQIKLVVLRPAGAEFTVVAVETGITPAAPPGGIAVFTPSAPIPVQAGDKLGLSPAGDNVPCFWQGGDVAADQMLGGGQATVPLAPGVTVTPMGSPSPAGYQLNVAAEIIEQTDLRVAAAAGPANATAGALAQLSATVTNAGPAPSPVTVTDTVPAGLKVETAVAGAGTCGVTGQQVTCSIPSLPAGAAAPVVVLVTPAAAGTYTNTVIAQSATEVAPADNAAGATLNVGAAPTPVPPAAAKCVVPALKRVPLRAARKLLGQLRCKAGKVTKARSKRIPKGMVIKTKPGRGEYASGSKVKLVVSAGKPKKKRR